MLCVPERVTMSIESSRCDFGPSGRVGRVGRLSQPDQFYLDLVGVQLTLGTDTLIPLEREETQVLWVASDLPFVNANVSAERTPSLGYFDTAPPTEWPT